MTDLARQISIMEAAGHDWVPVPISTARELIMAANLKKTVKPVVDKTTGKTKLKRVHSYDASKRRKIAKSKTRKVVAPAKARARNV